MTSPPVLFFDRSLPDGFDDLVAGRAIMVGPDDADLARADGVIAGSRRWGAAEMDLAPRLRVISRTGVGYDTVDVAAASARGIAVCYAPDAPTVSTAEHTIALLLAVTKDVRGWAARSASSGAAAVPGVELDGRTLGLFGYGRIARRVAVVARALGMRVIAHDPYVEAIDDADGVSLVDADQLWRQSDVVSLHAPATPDDAPCRQRGDARPAAGRRVPRQLRPRQPRRPRRTDRRARAAAPRRRRSRRHRARAAPARSPVAP